MGFGANLSLPRGGRKESHCDQIPITNQIIQKQRGPWGHASFRGKDNLSIIVNASRIGKLGGRELLPRP